jgi:hypothetical protein
MTFVEDPYELGFKQSYIPFIVTPLEVNVQAFTITWCCPVRPLTSQTATVSPTFQCLRWRPPWPGFQVREIIVERRTPVLTEAMTQITIQMQHQSIPGLFGADFIVLGGNPGDPNRIGSRRRYIPPLDLPWNDTPVVPGSPGGGDVHSLGTDGFRPMVITTIAPPNISAGRIVAITVHITSGTPS